MVVRALILGAIGIVLVVVLMFYSGMFMFGDYGP
jgi:hypothetical protein